MDEPTTVLNQAWRQRTLERLEAFKQAGLSLIVASHDARYFPSLADRSLYLHKGRLIETDPIKVRPITSPELTPSLRTLA